MRIFSKKRQTKDVVGWINQQGNVIRRSKRRNPQQWVLTFVDGERSPWQGSLAETGFEVNTIKTWIFRGRPWDHLVYSDLKFTFANRLSLPQHEAQTCGKKNLPEYRNIFRFSPRMMSGYSSALAARPDKTVEIKDDPIDFNPTTYGSLFAYGSKKEPSDIDLSHIDKVRKELFDLNNEFDKVVRSVDFPANDCKEAMPLYDRGVFIFNDEQIRSQYSVADQVAEFIDYLRDYRNAASKCSADLKVAEINELMKKYDSVLSRNVHWMQAMTEDFLALRGDEFLEQGNQQQIDWARLNRVKELNEIFGGNEAPDFAEIWAKFSSSSPRYEPLSYDGYPLVPFKTERTKPSRRRNVYPSIPIEASNLHYDYKSAKAVTEESSGNFETLLFGASAFDGAGDWMALNKEGIGNLDSPDEVLGQLSSGDDKGWGPYNIRLEHLVDLGVVYVGTNHTEVDEDRKHVFTGRFGIKSKKDLEGQNSRKLAIRICRRNWFALVRMGVLRRWSPKPVTIQALVFAYVHGVDQARDLEIDPENYDGNDKLARKKMADINHPPDGGTIAPGKGGGAPIYPFNKASVYESGHLEEWDNTPGMERVNLRHRTGTGIEMMPNGDKVVRVIGDNYVAVLGSNYIQAQGEVNIIASGNVGIKSYGDTYIDSSNNMSINCGGDLSVMVKGDMTEEIMGNKYIRVHRHHQEQIAGHKRVSASKDVEIKGSAITNVTTDTDFNVSAKRDANIAAVNIAELVSGRETNIQSGGRTNFTSRQDINVFTGESFRIEARWDITGKAFRDVVWNAERGEIHNTAHGMVRVQSRTDKIFFDAEKGISNLVTKGTFTAHAKGISLLSERDGHVDIKSGMDVRLSAASNVLLGSAGVIHLRANGGHWITSPANINIYNYGHRWNDQGSAGTPEQPKQWQMGDDSQMPPKGKVMKSNLKDWSRVGYQLAFPAIAGSSLMKWPSWDGDPRTLVGAPDPTVRMWYLYKDEDKPYDVETPEQPPSKILNRYYKAQDDKDGDGESKYSSNPVFQKDVIDQRKADEKVNECDKYNSDDFVEGPGDLTNESGVFTNSPMGEVGQGQKPGKGCNGSHQGPMSRKPETGNPSASASGSGWSPEDPGKGADVKRMTNSSSDYDSKTFWHYLLEEGGGKARIGQLKTNLAWPLIATHNFTGTPWTYENYTCIEDEVCYYAPYPGTYGIATAYNEPYWRPDVFRPPVTNYVPPGDRAKGHDKFGDRVAYDFHIDHVACDAEILEQSNKQLWSTGGMHYTGGPRPKNRSSLLGLHSSKKKSDRKHLRAVEMSFNDGETSHHKQPPANYRKNEKQDYLKNKQRVKKELKNRYEKEVENPRKTESRKHPDEQQPTPRVQGRK